MSTSFLESKTIQVNGIEIQITQLSGLDRFDFMDYCSVLATPDRPEKPSEEATEAEQEKYLMALDRYSKQWYRINFTARARLVAYGYRNGVDDLEERHKQIMATMTEDHVSYLHDEIAKFSGIPLPEPETTTEVETSTETASEETTTQEPVDPKI
ncbi:TPA: hypothetical protein ACPVX8_001290 [Vibrio parahaemolyticus]